MSIVFPIDFANISNMEIGNTIRGLRQQRPGLSQKKLALELGYAQSTICDWENGAIEPSASAVKKLAVYFDVTADYLLGLEDEFGNKLSCDTNS